MSNSFSLEQLTEGIRQRHLGSQNVQLVEKWARTGLLRGLDGVKRENMARLMENQASQVLKEQSSLSGGSGALANSGDMRGFTNIAFPIVRRVFGGLIANDLVSIQPMSLPSGLLFYLDYTRGTSVGGGTATRGSAYTAGDSVYNDPAGNGVQSGSNAVGGQYDLAGAGYSRVHSSLALDAGELLMTGTFGPTGNVLRGRGTAGGPAGAPSCMLTGSDAKFLQFDPQILKTIEAQDTPGQSSVGAGAGKSTFQFAVIDASALSNLDGTLIKEVALVADTLGTNPVGIGVVGNDADGKPIQDGTGVLNVRRLNQLGRFDTATNVFTPDPLVSVSEADAAILMVVSGAHIAGTVNATEEAKITCQFPISSALESGNGSSLVIPAFESNFGTGATDVSPEIPEIDIKVEALPVVAQTRKLRARWSPELAQDLNAYHSLDAEVELTQILSEQIALEIDREVLNDLLTQAGAANYYWSRAPGRFLNKETGAASSVGTFTGTVREWYETLVETIIDVANQIHRKTLRGSANFIVVGPDVATILEASVLYKPSYSLDGDGQVSGMVIGAEKVGTLSNRFTVYKDPYFPRNKVLVGYKGGSYLETGYVYAPYVPLIVTPTIFAPEDFTPRKGVMTRYGKKMVRSDFYGTVTCADMSVI